jgi:molybdopterin converting factor small subunit
MDQITVHLLYSQYHKKFFQSQNALPETITLKKGAKLQDVFTAIGVDQRELGAVKRKQRIIDVSEELHDGDTLDFIPMISGG